jgi:hypothetical protein
MSRRGYEKTVDTGLPDQHDRRRAFGRGFRQRNPLVLVAAALLAGLALLAFQDLLLHGDFTAVSQGRYLRITNDDYVHISFKLARLKKHPPVGPTVYLFGGSGAMESIVSEASMASEIQRAGGGKVNVISFSAHQESLAQTLAIIDNLPPGPGLLAVGLTPMRFTTSPAADAGLLSGRPILVHSPRLEALAPRLYGRNSRFWGILPGVFDYAGAYLRARAADGPFWGVRIPYAHHYYPPGAAGALPLAKRQEIFKVLARDSKAYAENADYNFTVLREIMRLAQERGYGVVLWDQPLNASAAGPDWGGVVPAYQKRALALARSDGIPYIRLEPGLGLRDADYADLYHLLERGRVKWQAAMAKRLAADMRILGGGGVASSEATATPPPVATP